LEHGHRNPFRREYQAASSYIRDRSCGIGSDRANKALVTWLVVAAVTRSLWREAPHHAAIGLFISFAVIPCENVGHIARH
jgi:hypothetical protein